MVDFTFKNISEALVFPFYDILYCYSELITLVTNYCTFKRIRPLKKFV